MSSWGFWGLHTAAADEYHQIDEWGNHARDGHWDYADPDVDMHMNGECWEWALWHKKYNPHLRIGIEWKWQDPEDRDYPEDEWIPIHAFTHDDHWAYDARGAFPLSEWRKWMGWDDVTFNHEPRVIGGSESYPSSNENIPTEGMAASAGTKPPLPTAPPKMVKQDGDWRIVGSTDGIRYAHVVEADVAEDLRRVAAGTGGGDCYRAAGRYILDNPTANVHLVHGDVDGRGAISGTRMGHAWIEDGDEVIDRSNGREVRLPKHVYYALGNIGGVVRYTPEEAMAMMGDTEHFGPWHETGAAHSAGNVVDHGTEWDEPEDDEWDPEKDWIGSGPPDDDDHHTAARTAMPAPMPEGITFHHHPTNDTIPTDPFPATRPPHEQVPRFSAPAVEARHNGETVGYLEWDPPLHATVVNGIQYGDHPPEVSMIKVHPDYRRHGIATALFDFARQHQGDLEHSDSRTGLGNLWVDYERSRSRALASMAGSAPDL